MELVSLNVPMDEGSVSQQSHRMDLSLVAVQFAPVSPCSLLVSCTCMLRIFCLGRAWMSHDGGVGGFC